jgi:hypothetical protein
MKLLKEYESVTQGDLLLIESMLQNAKELQHSCKVSKIIGHGNPDNNLESHCVLN